MKNKKILVVILGLIIVVGGIVGFVVYKKLTEPGVASTNTTESIDMTINTDDDNEKIDWSIYQDTSYVLSESITITEPGIYNLTGTIEDGVVTINTTGNVKLVLDSVNITNSSGPAIYVAEATDVVVELKEGSSNFLEDGATYSGYEADVIGTLFSHDDITFEGTGTLEVKANCEDAIVSKDDLKIVSGTYIINSLDDGIRGKDSVYIQNGDFTITSLGDAIKSTEDVDTTKGYILIENGNFNLVADLDGIQAQTKLLIQNGNFNITTGGGSGNISTSEDWGQFGGGHPGMPNGGYTNATTDTTSAKGIKSGNNLVIENGTFVFSTADDAIHCNSYLGIKTGNITIASGDDGIHADAELIIDGGNILITQSYEGLEGAKITINGGDINLVASDDGINVAGGNDGSAMGRPGENSYASSVDYVLTINDGNIIVDAAGDGIDVNGSAYIKGGNTIVYGPTNSGNGALDYDRLFQVDDGIFMAGGASGMAQSLSSSSSIYNVMINFNTSYGSGDVVSIVDEDGNTILEYESSKSYSSLIIASPKLSKGNYTIQVNGSEYTTFKISNIQTTIGNAGSMPGGGMQHGGGGRK